MAPGAYTTHPGARVTSRKNYTKPAREDSTRPASRTYVLILKREKEAPRDMMTWDAIRAHIREQHRPIDETETSFRLRCELPGAAAQLIHLSLRQSALGGHSIEVRAAVGEVPHISAVDALEYNQT